MGERADRMMGSIRERLDKLDRRVRTALIAVLALAAAAVIGLVVWNMTRPYAVLFTGLNSDEMTKVLSFLESNGVTDYRVRGSDQVLVPERQEADLRARFVLDGYASSGTGYELYLSNIGALSSDADRRQLQIYDLQDRLGATIRAFPGVRDAVVFITLGEDRRYILSQDDMTSATASVSLTMQGSNTLTSGQASAIRDLVSHAVQGLTIEEVSISDQAGNSYGAADFGSSSESAELKMSIERDVNAYIRNLVLQVLEPMFGPPNVSVTVNSTVDMSRRYEDAVLYEQPDWAVDAADGTGIIGRRIWGNAISRDEGTTAGGVVGTTTNADLNEYVVSQSDLTGNEREISTSGQVDYDVDTRRIQSDTPLGTVTDVMVSVVINSTEVDVPPTDTLVGIIARAAHIDPEVEGDKIAVMAYPFYVGEPVEPPSGDFDFFGIHIPRWAIGALIIGAVVFVLLLIVALLLRRSARKRRERRLEAEAAAREEAELRALTAAINAMSNEAEAVASIAAASGNEEAAEAARNVAKRMADATQAVLDKDRATAERELSTARSELAMARTALVSVGALATPGPVLAESAPFITGTVPISEVVAAAAEATLAGAEPMEAAQAAAAVSGAGLGPEEGVPPTAGADIMDVHTEYSMELRKRVRDFAEENPQIAAQMIKNWIRGVEEDAEDQDTPQER